jgi:hypothetical protein
MKKNVPAAKKRHPVRNGILIALVVLVVGFAGYTLVSGYIAALPKLAYAYGVASEPAKYPACSFAVISDTHYYDTSLGDTGAAFQKYLDNDRKLLVESGDILDSAVANILDSGVQFVLVNGDMTKDGEKQCHEHVASVLKKLTDKGIKVYVVPGNHDVNNPLAESYNGDTTALVPNVTKEEFAQIYNGCGYADAIKKDSGSLSYVVEPVPGLWLACMDSCRYYDNKPGQEETVPGKFTQGEETWLEGVLKEAEASGKAVMLMMHHGVVEHWPGQKKLYPEYLIEDYTHMGELLASYNVRLVFTGHYHAQDIAGSTFNGKGFIYDMETGSLVTDPCPVRYCAIDAAQNFSYKTVRLADTQYPGKSFGQYANFEQYAAESLKKSISDIAFNTLRGYLVNEKDSRTIADCVAAGFVAHYAGDEDITKAPPLDKSKLTLWSRIILSQEQYVIDGQWHDPSVKEDNNGSLSLITGQ